MRFDAVINPAGASGKTGAFWQRIVPMFEGHEICEHWSSRNRGVQEIVHDLTCTGRKVNLIVVGGDGTMNEAINGIADFQNCQLGFLPFGSANDLARHLCPGVSAEELARRILEGKTRREIDVGEVIFHTEVNIIDPLTLRTDPSIVKRERHVRFNVSAGMGWDAEICRGVQISNLKKLLNAVHLGKLVYLGVAAETIRAMKKFHCTVFSEERRLDFPSCMFTAVMNHRYEGGGFMFAPEADDQDGLLDVCTAGNLGTLDFFRLFPLAYSGRHAGKNEVYLYRAEEVRMKSDIPVWVHTDGEISCQSDDITVRLMDEKLRLMI